MKPYLNDESGISSEDTKDEETKKIIFHRSKYSQVQDDYIEKSSKLKFYTPINLNQSFELGKFII